MSGQRSTGVCAAAIPLRLSAFGAATLACFSPALAQAQAFAGCVLTVIWDDPAAALRGTPLLVSATWRGQLIVTEDANTPAAVFESSGKFVGRLGRAGRGPGELTFASWVDSELDNSIRVVDVDRVVVFDRALRPARTVVGETSLFLWTAAFLRPGAYVSQSRQQDSQNPMRTVQLVVRSDSGRVLARIEVPKLNGQKTFVKIARKLDDRRSFWMTESVVKGLQGYWVVVVSDGGARQQTFPQPRSRWMSADFDRDPVAGYAFLATRGCDARSTACGAPISVCTARRRCGNPPRKCAWSRGALPRES